jgi:hypothetical protein
MEILKPQHPSPEDQKFLRSATHIFWELDKTQLNFEKHYRGIITRVLNYGSPEEIQLIFRVYTEEAMKEVLIHPIRGDWYPRVYEAFCNLFEVPSDEKAMNVLYKRQRIKTKMGKILDQL